MGSSRVLQSVNLSSGGLRHGSRLPDRAHPVRGDVHQLGASPPHEARADESVRREPEGPCAEARGRAQRPDDPRRRLEHPAWRGAAGRCAAVGLVPDPDGVSDAPLLGCAGSAGSDDGSEPDGPLHEERHAGGRSAAHLLLHSPAPGGVGAVVTAVSRQSDRNRCLTARRYHGRRSSGGPPPPWSGVPGRRTPIAPATIRAAAPASPATSTPVRSRFTCRTSTRSTSAGGSAIRWYRGCPPKVRDPDAVRTSKSRRASSRSTSVPFSARRSSPSESRNLSSAAVEMSARTFAPTGTTSRVAGTYV